MSLPRKMTVNCSKCGKPLTATVFESVNTDYAEDITTQIMWGELFDVKCPHCGFVSHLEYDILYHDLRHGAMVWVVHKNNPEYASKVTEVRSTQKLTYKTLRIVEDMNALKEKVSCLEQGRDDRVIELCKVFVAGNLFAQHPDFVLRNSFYTAVTGKEIIYFYDEDGNNLCWEVSEETYGYIRSLYYNSPYEAQFDGNYAIVDYDWAESVLFPLLKSEAEKLGIEAEDIPNETPGQASNSEKMTCPQCGHKLPDDSKFCQYCGTAISEKEPVLPIVTVEPATRTPAVLPLKTQPTPTETITEQPPKTKKCKRHIVLPIILGIVTLLLGGLNVVQYTQNVDMQELVSSQNESLLAKDEEIQGLKEEVAEEKSLLQKRNSRIMELSDEVSELSWNLQFYEKYCAIVPEYSKIYHTYDCDEWEGTFWMYNINAAENYGYRPCPKCH